MSFSYQVILKPSDVKFTASKIPANFDDGACLELVVCDIKDGKKKITDIGDIEVVWYAEKWEWYTLDNKLLWVLRELEKAGSLSYVSMKRVEYMDDDDEEDRLPSEMFDSAELEEKGTRIVRSRSASVCSSSSEGRGKDTWGRKGRGTSTSPPPRRSCSRERISSKVDSSSVKIDSSSVKIESEDDDDENNGNGADEDVFAANKTSLLEWVEGRKKFCRLYSQDYNFQEYVAQNFSLESSLSIQPASSLVSLDSNFTNGSIISRAQRNIDPLSGYHGYGHFDDYNKQYLSKLREERLALKRRLKPYDVSSSSCSRVRSRRSSFSSYGESAGCSVRKRITIKEERITRTYSESIDYRDDSHHYRRDSRRDSRSDDDLRRPTRRARSYSEGERYRGRSSYAARGERRVSHTSSLSRRSCYESRSSLRSDYAPRRERTRRSLHGSYSSLRSSGNPKRSPGTSLCGSHSSLRSLSGSYALRLSSVPKEKLYEIWKRRREAYLDARYGSLKSLEFGSNSLAVTGYTCGLCFKSFKTRVRREQHSEELLHWACITCGRFFASHTALGQHVERAGHRKD